MEINCCCYYCCFCHCHYYPHYLHACISSWYDMFFTIFLRILSILSVKWSIAMNWFCMDCRNCWRCSCCIDRNCWNCWCLLHLSLHMCLRLLLHHHAELNHWITTTWNPIFKLHCNMADTLQDRTMLCIERFVSLPLDLPNWNYFRCCLRALASSRCEWRGYAICGVSIHNIFPGHLVWCRINLLVDCGGWIHCYVDRTLFIGRSIFVIVTSIFCNQVTKALGVLPYWRLIFRRRRALIVPIIFSLWSSNQFQICAMLDLMNI